LIPLLAFELLDLNVKPVFGMKGRKAGRLAFLRSETNIDYQTSSSYLKNVQPAVKDGKAVPLFSFGTLDAEGKLQRDPTFPDLPHFGEAYAKVHGKQPSGEAFAAWKTFFTAGFPAQKMVFLPKGTSSDVIETYQKAFERITKTPDFDEKSKLQLGVYTQATGKEAAKLKELATKVNMQDKMWMKNWLTTTYKVKF